jgi:hypothetical protein
MAIMFYDTSISNIMWHGRLLLHRLSMIFPSSTVIESTKYCIAAQNGMMLADLALKPGWRTKIQLKRCKN